MIQLNLLPDVKQQFIRTRRTKRLITLICLIAGSTAIGFSTILFLTTNVWQTTKINGLTSKIDTQLNQLREIEDLDKILTVQEQLSSLDDLHNKKTAATRLETFLPQILPQGVIISELEVDFEESTMEINGTSNSLETVNKFVDTLKFTDYIVYEVTEDQQTLEEITIDEEPVRAFNEVVLGSTAIEQGQADQSTGKTFTITLRFDPIIFNTSTVNVRLEVPKIVTTRSEIEQPGVLFETPTESEASNE